MRRGDGLLFQAKAMSERELQRAVLQRCKALKVMVTHQRPTNVRYGRTVTATDGNPGYPDLTFAYCGRVMFRELKRHGEKPTVGQELWLAALGGFGGVWRPLDLLDGTVDRELGQLVASPVGV